MPQEISLAEEYQRFGYPDTEQQDCDFLEAVFRAYGEGVRNILDIACGTGRHALEMAKRGYQVTGIDLSLEFIQAAQTAAGEQRRKVRFVQQDMTALGFTEAFEAAYVLFSSLQLLTTNNDLIRFMEGARAALKPGGLLVIEVWNQWAFIAKNQFGNAVFNRDEEAKGVRRHIATETTIGPYNNLMKHYTYRWFWRGEQELEPRSGIFFTRIFSPNELDLLCRLTGFKRLALFGATDILKKIEDPDRVEKVESPYQDFVIVLAKQG